MKPKLVNLLHRRTDSIGSSCTPLALAGPSPWTLPSGAGASFFAVACACSRLVPGIDVKNAKSTGVSVFETLFETPKPGVSAF